LDDGRQREAAIAAVRPVLTKVSFCKPFAQKNETLQRMHRLFRVGEMPTTRIEAFSDGVFAIIITLLVLEIHVPQVQGKDTSTALAHSLLAMAPKFLTYILSFVVVCIWWVAHHHLFHVLKRSDRGLLWLNSLFLLWLAFIPFPTALMGDFPGERIAVIGYGTVTTLAAVSFTFMRYYVFCLAKLVDKRIDRSLLKSAMLKSVLNPLFHAMAVLLAFVDIRLSIALYIILPLMFFIPGKLERYIHSGETGSPS
jgi:uncharacterized membrane protein